MTMSMTMSETEISFRLAERGISKENFPILAKKVGKQ